MDLVNLLLNLRLLRSGRVLPGSVYHAAQVLRPGPHVAEDAHVEAAHALRHLPPPLCEVLGESVENLVYAYGDPVGKFIEVEVRGLSELGALLALLRLGLCLALFAALFLARPCGLRGLANRCPQFGQRHGWLEPLALLDGLDCPLFVFDGLF